MPPHPPEDQPSLPGMTPPVTPPATPQRPTGGTSGLPRGADLPAGFDPLDHDAVFAAMSDPTSPLYYLPASTCRWCGCTLEELPSGPWVDDYGSQSCTVPRPGRHWPVID